MPNKYISPPPSLQGSGDLFVRLAKWIAIFTAIVIGIVPPVAYFYFGYSNLASKSEGEITYAARQISQIVAGNPEYWQFEDLRIGELLEHEHEIEEGNLHRVLDNTGMIVAQRPVEPVPSIWPAITLSKPVLDFGIPVGRVEFVHSYKDLILSTSVLAMISVVLAILIFWALRLVPLRLLQGAWDRISYLASHDDLTGLPNRARFLDKLDQALLAAKRRFTPITVFSLDLDHFKDVNDTLGHGTGDALLEQAASRMRACLREEDTLARLGGDEFAIFQIGEGDPHMAADVAERLISTLGEPFDLDGHEAIIGASVGIAMNAECKLCTSAELIKHADLALYRSKNNGRNAYHFFEKEMDAALEQRKLLEMEIRKALHREEFELYYQPQVDLKNQSIKGVEALLRWHHAKRGAIPPDRFIPVAESSGLIKPLTEWVLHEACHQAVKWAPVTMAVNLSPSLFLQNGLIEMVKAALAESGLPPERLELEITEEILISDTEVTLGALKDLKALGVHIAMDDFGTGYSSLSYLRRFPFDKIKIDKSFIGDVNESEDAQAIVRAIIGMSRALKMQINAEGVETIEQAQTLLAEGCEEVQGYLYGRPMRSVDVEALLSSTQTVGAAPATSERVSKTA